MRAESIRLVAIATLALACSTTVSPTPPATADPPPASTLGVSLDIVAARAAHTATTLPDGRVLVTGGCVTDGCGTATAESFLVAADGTGALLGPPMATARQGHSATAVGDDVVIVGGWSGEGRPSLSTVEIYRSGGVPETSAPISVGRGGHAAAALGDGRVLVVGGWVASRTYTASTEIIDPTTGAVSAAADLPWTADGLEATALPDGRVLVTGGQVRSGVGTDAAAVYDASTDSWQSVGPMSDVRFKHTTASLGDGRALIIGGTTDDTELLAATEVFDPIAMSFSLGPDMSEPRYKMTGGAVGLDDHRVLIGGGGQSVELLDLDAGTSRVVESLDARASFATLNWLGGGAWLVLGGYDDEITLRRHYLVIELQELEEAGA